MRREIRLATDVRCFAALVGVGLLAFGLGCAGVGPGHGPDADVVDPLRISELLDEPEQDPVRRASLQLVREGLDADIAGQRERARARYERALTVDVANPYAYLAIARQRVEAKDYDRALLYLDRSATLLQMQDAYTPRVRCHLDGLRGAALYGVGRGDEGYLFLDAARTMAPDVWHDGELSPAELR